MDLVSEVRRLMASDVRRIVDERVEYFISIGRGGREVIFSELSFCILTANYSAEKAMRIQDEIGLKLIDMDLDEIRYSLRRLGYRYPNKRALYIYRAREHIDEVISRLRDESIPDMELREWLSRRILGLGYKEASHFLRNTGRFNVAIIDYHILNLLRRYNILSMELGRGRLDKSKYIEVECHIKTLADKAGLHPGILDLYLWYIETGKILK